MGNLRVHIENVISNRTLILFNIYVDAGTRSRLHAWKSAKTRFYPHLIVSTRKCSRVTDRSRSQHNRSCCFSCPTSTPISTIGKYDKIRFVALCYDVIRSDAVVPIVEAIVLIGKKNWQPKIFPRSTRLSRLTSRHDKI